MGAFAVELSSGGGVEKLSVYFLKSNQIIKHEFLNSFFQYLSFIKIRSLTDVYAGTAQP